MARHDACPRVVAEERVPEGPSAVGEPREEQDPHEGVDFEEER